MKFWGKIQNYDCSLLANDSESIDYDVYEFIYIKTHHIYLSTHTPIYICVCVCIYIYKRRLVEDIGAWHAADHGIIKCRTQFSS